MADAMKPQAPKLGEISPPEDPFNPLKLSSLVGATAYMQLLQPTDTILQSKGGVENLQVYKELLRDDQVFAAWGQRRLALTSAQTVVEPGAEDALSKAAAEALDLELKAMPWDDITDKMLSAIFYGWGVAEVMWKPLGGRVAFDTIKVRDRSRFRFDLQQNLYLWTVGGFAKMPERKFWTFNAGSDNHDEPYGLGLAHSLYWPVFFKRSDIKFWLIFLEKFGMPTAMAKLPAGHIDDPQTVRKAKAMLQQIATDAGVVVPDNVVVELLEAARSGAGDYSAMHSAMDKAIAKIIVGQTATTEGTPGKLGNDDTQKSVKQEITKADSDLLCGSFNAGPVRWWCEWNFPGAVAPRVYRHTSPPEDLTARAERDTKIYALGYEPEESYITETYGEGWVKRKDPLEAVGGLLPGLPGAAGKKPGGQQEEGQDFAEGDSVALAALKAARRGDQQAMFEAAKLFAAQSQSITGRRVDQLLKLAEFSGDAETFRRGLDELMAERPPESTIDKLTRALLTSRMLGALRSTRKR